MEGKTGGTNVSEPDYVREFKKTKPKNTEVKRVNGHYYLYERCSVYDKTQGRPVKVSGKMLGTLTPNGLVKCKRRKPRKKGPTRFEQYMEQHNPKCLLETLDEKLAGIPEDKLAGGSETASAGEQYVYEQRGALSDAEQMDDENNTGEEAIVTSEITCTEQVTPPIQSDSQSDSCDSLEERSEGDNSLATEESTDLESDVQRSEEVVEAVEPEIIEEVLTRESLVAVVKQVLAEVVNGNGFHQPKEEIVETSDTGSETGVEIGDFIQAAHNAKIPPLKASDDVEIGASLFIITRTKKMREDLKECFGDFWPFIYVIALIRTIYDVRFRRIEVNYFGSILSHLFPDLPLDRQSIAEILQALGARRNDITRYMSRNLSKASAVTLVDGHRILSSASNFPNAELGYDSQQRHQRQINLMYLFSYDPEFRSAPLYYKQYNGGTIDDNAVEDLMQEVGKLPPETTIVGDKGCLTGAEIVELVNKGLRFVVPLRRGNRFAKNNVPAANSNEWDKVFCYNGRAIMVKKVDAEEFRAYIFFDTKLYADEMATIAGRTSKENAARAEAGRKALRTAEAALNKTVKSLEIVDRKIERAIKRVELAQLRYKKADETARTKERLAEEAAERLRKRIGRPSESRSQNAADKALEAASRARQKANEAWRDLEEDQIIVENLSAEKSRLVEDKKVNEESIQNIKNYVQRMEDFERTGYFDAGFDIDVDFGSTFKDIRKMFPETSADILPSTSEKGTITLLTNREDPPEEIYNIFKQRNNIEQYFLIYEHSCDFETSYMRSRNAMEGWLFLNHLSSEIAVSCINEIGSLGKSKDISFKDEMTILRKIHAAKVDGSWLIPHITSSISSLCALLGFSPEAEMREVKWDA